MSSLYKATAHALAAAALLATVGCYMPTGRETISHGTAPFAAAGPAPKAGPRQVKVDSHLTYSADENRPAADEMLACARISLNPEIGPPGLDRKVRRWPDVALDLLRKGVGGGNDAALRAVAESYDRTFEPSNPNAGWAAAFVASTTGPSEYARFAQVRRDLLAMLQSGRVAEAMKLDPSGALSAGAPTALRSEAARLAGLARLLGDDPKAAAARFAQSLQAASSGSRHVQFEIGLLLSEAERRSERDDAAQTAWRNAIAASETTRDPDLWERAILAKPANAAWPRQAAIAGAGEPTFGDSAAPDTAEVLIGVGKMRAGRGAPQAALLAFSRAEAEGATPGKRALGKLYRAQTMIGLDQAATALPSLETLAKFPDPRIARRAQAIQGDVFCRVLRDRTRGIQMMTSALSQPDAGEWPDKTRLSANLALYCILEGREDEGLTRLRMAEAKFHLDAQWEDLADALKNEAASLRAAGRDEEAATVQRRAADVLRQIGSSV